MFTANLIATIDELQKQLGEGKRLLLALCECPQIASPDLRELASTAVLAEEMVDDLSRSIHLRQRIVPMRLAPHEIRLLETAIMVDSSIGLALRRTVEPACGASAIH